MVKEITFLSKALALLPLKQGAWPILYLLFAVAALGSYLPVQSANFWLALFLVVTYIRYPLHSRGGYRFLVLSALMGVLCFWLPVKTCLFFALLFAALFAMEAQAGRIQAGIFVALFLLSPVSGYIAEIFSFPIRLKLTDLAAAILSFTGNSATAVGNAIVYNGTPFDVDKACMGLSMFITSLLMALLLTLAFEVRFQRRLAAAYTPLILAFFAITNAGANMARIICLVYFNIGAGDTLHGAIGILCWLVYGILPGALLVKILVKQVGRYEPVSPIKGFGTSTLQHFHVAQLGLLVLLTLAHRVQVQQPDPILAKGNHWAERPGYSLNILDDGIAKYANHSSLVYTKPIRGFYSTDHNPSICWRGSGYAFSKVELRTQGAASHYKALLTKENTVLHTAWWYESGTHRTINQMKWRVHSMRTGKTYYLVNITADTELGLAKAIEQWQAKKTK